MQTGAASEEGLSPGPSGVSYLSAAAGCLQDSRGHSHTEGSPRTQGLQAQF